MNLRTTVILAVVAFAGVAALWLLGPEKPKADATPTITIPGSGATTKLFEPQPDQNQVTQVTWERAGRPTLVFERPAAGDDPTRPGDWSIVEPIAAAAETSLVNALVSNMLRLDTRGAYEPGAKGAPTPADAGLDPPQAALAFRTAAGVETRVEIGRQPQLSNETWVRIAGKPTMYLCTRDFAPDLKRELKDFRSKGLLKVRAADVTTLRITHDERTAEFRRPLDGTWSIEAPVQARAEKQPLDDLVARVVGLRATEFIEDAPVSLAAFGFEPPFVRIELTHERRPQPRPPAADPAASAPSTAPAPPETITVLIGGFADRTNSKRYIKLGDAPSVATIAQTSVDPVIPDLARVRNPLVTGVNPADLTELHYTVGDETVALTNVGGLWRGAGDLIELDHAAIGELLNTFAELRAFEFHDQPPSLDPYGLNRPRATLRARLKDTAAVVTLHVGRLSESGRNAFVALEGVPTVFLVSAEQAEKLVVAPLTLRARTIFAFIPDELERLAVSRTGTNYLAVRQTDGWTLMEPPDCAIDRASINQMTNDLARLRARRVVAAGDDGVSFGLASPVASFTLTLKSPTTQPAATEPADAVPPPPPPTTHRLVLGFKDNVAYCRKNDEPYIYEIDNSVYLSLIAELIDRRLFTFAASDVVALGVEVAGNPRPFLIRRADDGEWQYAPDPQGENISSKKVNDYLAELAATRVDAYLAYRDGDLTAHGLGETAAVRVTIGLGNTQELHLRLAEPPPGELPRKCGWVEERRIFLLKKEDSEKLLRGLDFYGAPDEPATPLPTPEGLPALPPGIGPG